MPVFGRLQSAEIEAFFSLSFGQEPPIEKFRCDSLCLRESDECSRRFSKVGIDRQLGRTSRARRGITFDLRDLRDLMPILIHAL